VYTDVAFYYAWIQEQTNGCCASESQFATRNNNGDNQNENNQMAYGNNSDNFSQNVTSPSQSYRMGNLMN